MNLGTYVDGRSIGYDEQTGTLDVGGTAVTPQQLRDYDDAGQVSWESADNRAWLDSSFPSVATETPEVKRRQIPVIAVVLGAALLCGVCSLAAILSPDSDSPPATVSPAAKPAPAAEAPTAVEPIEPAAEAPVEPAAEAPEAPAAEEPAEPAMTMGQEQGVAKAQDYLGYTAFSRKGLIEQLKYEGFSKGDATFAVDYIDVDWKAQAATKAQDYIDYSSFSRKGLIEQLEYEGFTKSQAKYGAKAVGY